MKFAYRNFGFTGMIIFEMGTQGRDIEILVTIGAWEIGSDLVVNLKIIDGQTIFLFIYISNKKNQMRKGGKWKKIEKPRSKIEIKTYPDERFDGGAANYTGV